MKVLMVLLVLTIGMMWNYDCKNKRGEKCRNASNQQITT